ncbi:biotin-dependent carboxyltransferase family protein [Chromohalobacter sarecensis]|uniref:Biotin-dependent carboxyltransferase family protein n=1 Tax=Chromohalobacter sarecensis TaxID=245294 RepID=A0ABV9D0R2_9GAMM|nr:biotin-dependent carboxyltransferase family protein [Chromohalobacter sarecensis]MCK0713878.1 biotin-dependent carboxyltransferase family protein [Chromohalobacter sarecensis]
MKGLIVERAGPLTLIQDGGRFGVRHLGVTQGGAADWVSLGWANWLLGNAPQAPGVEITVGGLTLYAETSATLALTGADLGATLDDAPLAPGTRFTITAGQRLAFESPRAGLRAYLAFPGGLDATPVLGSVSSTVRESLGGLDGQGRVLDEGDCLTWAGTAGAERTLPLGVGTLPGDEERVMLALVSGAQIADFSGTSVFEAFNTPWQVDQRADRMGVRLTGSELRYLGEGMVSEGIPLGAVQVPADGQPIVLLNDRQTIGGYPRLGALTPLACARLAQCQPGTEVWLTPVAAGQARNAHLRQLACWR